MKTGVEDYVFVEKWAKATSINQRRPFRQSTPFCRTIHRQQCVVPTPATVLPCVTEAIKGRHCVCVAFSGNAAELPLRVVMTQNETGTKYQIL